MDPFQIFFIKNHHNNIDLCKFAVCQDKLSIKCIDFTHIKEFDKKDIYKLTKIKKLKYNI
jgi:hypothetical protein